MVFLDLLLRMRTWAKTKAALDANFKTSRVRGASMAQGVWPQGLCSQPESRPCQGPKLAWKAHSLTTQTRSMYVWAFTEPKNGGLTPGAKSWCVHGIVTDRVETLPVFLTRDDRCSGKVIAAPAACDMQAQVRPHGIARKPKQGKCFKCPAPRRMAHHQ